MPATSTTMSGSYKQIYGKGGLIDALGNLSHDLWTKIGTSPNKPRGQGFYFPVHVAGNLSGGPTSEMAPLREAQSEEFVQAVVTPAKYEWSIEVSNDARYLGEGDQATFVRVVDNAFNSKADTAMTMLGNDVWLDGTGTLTLVNGAVSNSTTVVVDEAIRVREKMVLDGYESSTLKFQGQQVATVDPFTNTLTMKNPVTIADNGILRINRVDGSTVVPIAGMVRMVDTTTTGTTYLGVSRNTYRKWRGNVLDAGSVSVSGDLLQQAFDRVRIICGKTPSTIASNMSQRRKYLNAAQPQRRFMNGTFDLGHDTLEFNGKGWMIDDKCQRDKIWLLDLADFEKYIVRDLDVNTEGGELKPVPGYRKAIAYYEFIGQVACQNPYWHMQISNLAVPSI